MDTKKLTPSLSVSGQLKLSDLKLAKDAGYKTIINNRPDGEALGQPRSETLAIHAKELSLTYQYLPINPGQMGETDVKAFKTLLTESNGPVLAFCRTGTRSTTLWAKSQAGDISANDIIEKAKIAGYDMSALRQELEKAGL